MKIRSAVILAAILIVTIIVGVLGLCRIEFGQYKTIPLTDLLTSAEDTKGSIYAVYSLPEGADIDRAVSIIRGRIDAYGLGDYKVYRYGDQVRVETPVSTAALTSISTLVSPEHFEFVDSEGNVMVDGDHIASAKAKAYAGSASYYYIEYQFDEQGTKDYFEMTAALLNSTMDITVDGSKLFGENAPTVSEIVSDGKGYIQGSFSRQSAKQLAAIMELGSLPAMTRVQQGTATARLGENAYANLFAGLLAATGAALVLMIVLYGLNGVIGALSTAIYLLIYLIAAIYLGFRMSLAGLTGAAAALAYLLAVNFASFACIKRDMKRIEVTETAAKSGFAQVRMFAFDAVVALAVAGIVLGALVDRYFGWALTVGVIAAYLAAELLTYWLCRLMYGAGLTNKRLYGVSAKEA